MKSKESKALLEVREWKEAIYSKVKHLSVDEQITAILKMAHFEMEKYQKEKSRQPISRLLTKW